MIGDIKTDIELFFSKTRISGYKLCKEAGINRAIVYNLLSGRRKWMLNRTEKKLREAMEKLAFECDA